MNVDRPSLGLLLSEAARGRVSLAALAASVAAAALGGAWLLVAGSLLYALVVAWQVASPRFWRRALAAEAEAALQLPSMSQLSDPALRVIVRCIKDRLTRTARLLRRAPAAVRADARAALAAMRDLREHAARAAWRADELGRCLWDANLDSVEFEIRRLTEAIQHASDDAARAEYQRARAVRHEQLHALDEMNRERERLFAALQRILDTVEAIPARLQYLRALDLRARQDLVGDLDETLARLNGRLTSSEKLLERVASEPAERLLGG